MQQTAGQIIDAAAEEIGVKTAESDLEAEDYKIILNRLNDLGEEWADANITPTFVHVVNNSDLVQIDNNARAAFKLELAIRIAPAFQRVVTPDLRESARQSYNRLSASIYKQIKVKYPDSLPIGSGNECPSDNIINDRFFPEFERDNF